MIKRRLFDLLLLVVLPVVSYGADCPSAKNAKNGFLLRNSGAISEFRPAQGPVVAITNSFGSSEKQTVYSYQGLFDLSRSSSDERYAIYPLDGLDKLLPIKKDGHHVIPFVPLDPQQSSDKWTLELTVTKRETVAVGRCKYEVFRIREETKRGGERVELWSALYSPDLHATLAKIYDEGTSEEAIVSYDHIQSLSH
ncbi:hypothetical protein [Rhizobium yanglingense]